MLCRIWDMTIRKLAFWRLSETNPWKYHFELWREQEKFLRIVQPKEVMRPKFTCQYVSVSQDFSAFTKQCHVAEHTFGVEFLKVVIKFELQLRQHEFCFFDNFNFKLQMKLILGNQTIRLGEQKFSFHKLWESKSSSVFFVEWFTAFWALRIAESVNL